MSKGSVIRQVTRGDWCVRDIQRVDEEKGKIYFSASGVNKGEDPYFVHYYSIGLDGRDMRCLTPEAAEHSAVYSSDHRFLIDSYSTVGEAPVTLLRDAADGKLLRTLEKADISRSTPARAAPTRPRVSSRTTGT